MVWKCALKSADGNEEVDGVGARRWRKRQLTWRVRPIFMWDKDKDKDYDKT